MVMGRGVPSGQEFTNCTHTCTTCDRDTAGLPIPVQHPNDEDPNFYDKEDLLLDYGFFFEDEDMSSNKDDSESESDEKVNEDEVDELAKEAALSHFNAILSKAQKMAIKAEQEAAGQKPKWKWDCSGTKHHHAQNALDSMLLLQLQW